MKRTPLILSVIAIVLAGGAAAFFIYREPVAAPVVPEAPKPEPEPVPEPPKAAAYRVLTIATANPKTELEAAVGAENVAFVLALNRIDLRFVKQGATLVAPASFDDAAFPGFPARLPVAEAVPKLVLVSQRVQSFAAYEYGVLVRTGPTSTGKQSTPTPSKLFSTNWKGKRVISSFSDEWILEWSWNLDNWQGVSMHQYELPGYPASHSCIRLRKEDALWLYDWAEPWILTPDEQTRLAHGTPVIVFGGYGFGKPAPWTLLPENPNATTVPFEEASATVEQALQTILERQAERAAVTNPGGAL